MTKIITQNRILEKRESITLSEKIEFLEHVIETGGRVGKHCAPYCKTCPVYDKSNNTGRSCGIRGARQAAEKRLPEAMAEKILLGEEDG